MTLVPSGRRKRAEASAGTVRLSPPVPNADVPSFCGTAHKRPLRLLWMWHAAVVAEYQKPLDLLARCPDVDVSLLVPCRWPERAGEMVRTEQLPSRHFRMVKARTLFTGIYYLHFYPSLLFHLLRLKPHVTYCYEEAHTLIAALVLLLRRLLFPQRHILLYAAQNIVKRYPLPFRLFESYCFRNADMILACGVKVAETLRAKGYRGPLEVVPLPTDTSAFQPDPASGAAYRRMWKLDSRALVIGYAGKLAEEKGLYTLLSAFVDVAREMPHVHLFLAGGGPLREELTRIAKRAGVGDRLHFAGVVHNRDLPSFMNALDLFVLPSETRPNWREQFGRVAVEAMSCGVPVVGSDSGEIPNLLQDAGLVFPEGDAKALAGCLRQLLTSGEARSRHKALGRERVLQLYSLEEVAALHYRIYHQVVRRTGSGA